MACATETPRKLISRYQKTLELAYLSQIDITLTRTIAYLDDHDVKKKNGAETSTRCPTARIIRTEPKPQLVALRHE